MKNGQAEEMTEAVADVAAAPQGHHATRERQQPVYPIGKPRISDDPNNIGHDRVHFEVFGRVNRSNAHGFERCFIFRRDDAADDDRNIVRALLTQPVHHSRTSATWLPDRMDSPTMCTSSSIAALTISAGVSRMPS
jgi:hypothetical protein